LAAGDDRASVAHPLARRRRDPRDVRDDRLLHMRRNVLRRGLLVRAADLTDHHDTARRGVRLEKLEAIDEIHAADRVAADADARRLPEPARRRLPDRLVRQRARPRHDADRARLVDRARHDAELALARRDDAGAVRPDQPAIGVIRQHRLHAHHVEHRHALGDADDQLDAGVRRLEDRVRGERRRHVDHARRRARLALGLRDRVIDRQPQMLAAAASRRDAGDDFRAVLEALLGVERALTPRKPLRDDLRLLADEDAHAAPPASATTFDAASFRSSAGTIASPLSASICLPFSTFVPSSRTTTGTLTSASVTAAITPSAIRSQRTIPPKMFTRIAFTFSLVRMMLNASLTRSAVAPPPTSRKFAGSPPCSLIRSIVAIASPAPLTMQAMLPSSET